MYAKFRELLERAVGHNEWVVAINADIRGFSGIMSGDPAQTALYLRAVYGKILDNHFKERSFFKPTGDGLLVIVPFPPTEEKLAEVTEAVIGDALALHGGFAEMIAKDKLLQFPHPEEIGIGLAVGSVSRLVAGKATLDYTGRALNLASRLMDLARPSGVVFDSSLDFSALERDVQEQFRPDHVYLRGVAEQDGVDFYFTSPPTLIPERYRKPITKAVLFEEESRSTTGAEARKLSPLYYERLTFEPSDRSTIEVLVVYPVKGGGKGKGRRWFTPEFEYVVQRGLPSVVLDYPDIADKLRARGVPPRTKVSVDIAYTVDADILQEAGISI
jgi:class 3 adenylate cyclase